MVINEGNIIQRNSGMNPVQLFVADTVESKTESQSEDTWGISPPRGPRTFFYNLKAPSRSSEGYSYKILVFDYRVFHRHLLWHTLYKGITVLEWFCLSQGFTFLKNRTDSLSYGTCLVGALSCSAATRKGVVEVTSRLKPIFRSLQSYKCPKWESDSRSKDGTLLDLFHQVLGIPQRGLPKNDLYNLTKIEIPRTIPRRSNRIGVGYKDKGSMGPDREEPYLSDDEILTPYFEVSHFVERWQNTKAEFQFP